MSGPEPVVVTDPGDPRVADYRDLKDAARRRVGSFIAESELVIRRLLGSRHAVTSLLLTPQRRDRLRADLPSGVPVFVAEQPVLDALVGFPLHRGALALAERGPLPPVASVLEGARVVLALEDVVDPDNVGSVFRHVAGFGADAVLLSPHAGDPLYRKAVRSSMGWSLHVPWTRVGEGEWPRILDHLRADGWRIVATTPAAPAVELWRLGLGADQRVVVLLGSEHAGLSTAGLAAADVRVRIPMAPGVDSLNVATTAALVLYELRR